MIPVKGTYGEACDIGLAGVIELQCSPASAAETASAMLARLKAGDLVLTADPAKSVKGDIGAERSAVRFLTHDAVARAARSADRVSLKPNLFA